MPESIVDIIVNCHNGEKYLNAALDSIYKQTFNDWNIIFWDNASTDRSAKIAKSYGEKLKYFRGQNIVPLGEARNKALKEVKAKYIAFLDVDDVWLGDKLRKQIPLFEKNPKIGIVFSDALVVSEDGENIIRKYFKKRTVPRGRIFPYLFRYYEWTICMPTVVLKTEVLKTQKTWFNENFQIATDFDFFLRIAMDWECDYVNEPLAKYRVHESSQAKKMYLNSPLEAKRTIEHFCAMFPGFENNYKDGMKFHEKKINFMMGKYHWMNGNVPEARKYFAKNISSLKMLLAYAATFMPYGFALYIWKTLKKQIKLNK